MFGACDGRGGGRPSVVVVLLCFLDSVVAVHPVSQCTSHRQDVYSSHNPYLMRQHLKFTKRVERFVI
jgi:hypothetical protein